MQRRYVLEQFNVSLRTMKIFGVRLSTIGEMAFGIILCAWGWVEDDAMAVAIGFPLFLSAANDRRFDRLEQQIAELGERRAEAR